MEEKEFNRPLTELRGSLLGAVMVFVTDAFFLNQGVLALVTVVGALLVLLPMAWWAYRCEETALAKLRTWRAGLFLAAGTAVLLANGLNNGLAQRRAKVIVEACERFKDSRLHYPERLQELVPDFLPQVPKAKLALMYSDFRYRPSAGRHVLSWVVFPPYGRRFYNFEEKRWASGE